MLEKLKIKYPGAIVWPFGDTPELADELANLVKDGIKTAGCGLLSSFNSEDESPTIGGYNVILNGKNEPVCVIRLISLKIVHFCDVGEYLARKEGEGEGEGEGDLSLEYWREGHKDFFQREGTYDETMELVAEEFELIEVL